MNDLQLSNLMPMESPEAVLKEAIVILDLISPDFNAVSVDSAFKATVNLFNGKYPGYRACNTEYHDLRHTIDTFLAMIRLIHGALLDGEAFTDRQILLGLISALLHDAGYIQEEHDTEGTGSKYTTSHVRRSMDFLERHGSEFGLSCEEIAEGRAIILCTDLAVDVSTIRFPTAKGALIGKMLGSADLLAQMADRTYLEKLLFLYYEFKEAGIGDYESEVDLLRKTLAFYDFIAWRLKTALDAVDRFLSSHFTLRWGIKDNLYNVAIEKQKKHLRKIMEIPNSDPRNQLKRHGIVEKIRTVGG
ncbi:MAG: hypothetical protein EHM85_17740 [Desulfobacteraceae bacterium]|nr:MAG: hypothetical protein EHM85_17740 [Desulfobacteraceae bacterium]